MTKLRLLFIFCLAMQISILSGCNQSSIEIFISPSGSDFNPGTFEKPFASLEKARAHIRLLKKDNIKSDITVYLRGGTYFMAETFKLGLEDSAPEGYKITYSNYPGERPVLSSGVRLTGWKRVENDLPGLPLSARGKVWSADFPEGIRSFYTLYKSESRLPRAVTEGFFPTILYDESDPDNRSELHFPPGKMKNWPHMEDVEIFILPRNPWTMNILPLKSVNVQKNIATTSIPGTYPLESLRRDHFPEGTVWVENVFEGMTKPGNWVMDSKKRKVYLWPADNEPGTDILAPGLKVLIKVAGDSRIEELTDIPVRGIHFRGLTFTHADRDTWGLEDSGIQHDWEVEDRDNALLRFRGAEYCSVDACHFYNSGGNAIRLDYHAQHIEVKNSLFHDLGAAAVQMLGYGPGTKDVNKYNKIINNHIHNCGQIWWHSQMITAWQSGENLIAHNYIHNVPRKAICIAGVRPTFFRRGRPDQRENVRSIRFNETNGASSQEEVYPFLHSRNNIVEYNHIHHALEMLGDGAAINLSGTDKGNIVRYNFIHDIDNQMADACIRTDNAQHGTIMSHNIVYRSYAPGFCPKGYNVVKNNYMINVSSGNAKGMIRGLGNFGNSDIEYNIFFSIDDRDHFYNFIKEPQPPEVYEAMTDNTVDKNIYYSPGSAWLRDNTVLSDLKKYGLDQNSLYTDPLFEDWENGDFRLKKNSPAFDLGIQPLEIMDKVGLTSEFPSNLKK